MIHCSAFADIEGAHIMTDCGERLTVIGNIYPRIGSMIWTDGVVCYGDRPVVGGGGHVMRKYIGYLFSNGSAINYLDNQFDERQYIEKCENSYVVTGVNHAWILNAGGGKISGINTTDLLNAKDNEQRKVEITVPKESEVRDACVDDQGDLHMIVLTVDNDSETIRIYRNDSLVVSKRNVKTITWPDKKTTEAEMVAWYSHIEKDGSYNVLSAYKESKMHKVNIGRDTPYTGIIRNEKDWQKYTGKTWANKIVQVYDFWGFWYDRRAAAARGLRGRNEIEDAGLGLNLRQVDEMLKSGKMTHKDLYGDWYTNIKNAGEGALYSISHADVANLNSPCANDKLPLFPLLKESILDFKEFQQYKIYNNDDEAYSVVAESNGRRFYPTVTPNEINFCTSADPVNTDIRVIINPPGHFWSVALGSSELEFGDYDPWSGYFDPDSMGIQSFTIGYYIDEYPGDYKRERQHLIVAAYHTERPGTLPITGDPQFKTESKPITIPVGDGEIKLNEIKPVNPIVKIDDMKALHGYLKTVPDDGISDSKRMIGQCFTSNGQIASYSFKAEDTWIADIHNAGDGKGGEIPMLLTDTGLTIIGAQKKASNTYNSRHNMRVNYYDPITDYLAKG